MVYYILNPDGCARACPDRVVDSAAVSEAVGGGDHGEDREVFGTRCLSRASGDKLGRGASHGRFRLAGSPVPFPVEGASTGRRGLVLAAPGLHREGVQGIRAADPAVFL